MNFLDDRFSKNTPILDFMKIRPVETEFYHANRQTDRRAHLTTLRVAFSYFANTPKKSGSVRE
jgi:hypothetical protein